MFNQEEAPILQMPQMSLKISTTKFLLSTLCIILVAYSSSVALFGSGVLTEYLSYFSSAFWGGYKNCIVPLLIFFLFSVCCFFSKYSFWFLLFPITFLMDVYFPIGIVFGIPNDGQVASAFNTDPAEAIEFFKTVFGWTIVFPISAMAALLGSYFLSCKFKLEWSSNKFLIFVLVASIAISSGTFKAIHEGYKHTITAWKGISELKKAEAIQSKWNIKTVHPRKQIFVLVIGESARRDYMHAYGYPIANTPFMESKGTLIDGAVSADDYTIPSIQKMLTFSKVSNHSKDYANLEYNILDAANLAGFETYWFSNQGKINKKDTPITVFANRALHAKWLKESLDRSERVSDSELIPLLKKAVLENVPDNRSKFIVLHLMGSHSAVCERLIEQPLLGAVKNQYFQDPLCYVSSIKQTDSLLEKIDQTLRSSGKTYSVVYLSDHGVSHNEIQGKIVMNHASPASEHRSIPLYKFEDGETKLQKIKARKFMSNLTEGILYWLGISTKEVSHPRDLFSEEDQKDERNELEKLSGRRLDPSIDIRGK